MAKSLYQTPWGFAVKEPMIREIDRRLKKQPDLNLSRKAVTPKIETQADSMTDVSVISSQIVDTDNEVLVLDGLNADLFLQHPRVFWDHDYGSPPIGYCRKLDRDGDKLLAKTQYVARPADANSAEWFPSVVFNMIAHDPCLLPHKSIGVLPVKRQPTRKELEDHPDWKGAVVLADSLMLEYSVVGLPANFDCVLVSVTKSLVKSPTILKRLGVSETKIERARSTKASAVDWTAELERAVAKRLADIDVDDIVRGVVRKIRTRQ